MFFKTTLFNTLLFLFIAIPSIHVSACPSHHQRCCGPSACSRFGKVVQAQNSSSVCTHTAARATAKPVAEMTF
ncbi:hypothetical protein B0H11DRAFT_1106918 [Mycena galericulata]|nr:hypothetical protein B0H11DRAFT_1106918 [Mycena galericulata]